MMVKECDVQTVDEFVSDVFDCIDEVAQRLKIQPAAAMVYLAYELLGEMNRADSGLASDFAATAFDLCRQEQAASADPEAYSAAIAACGKAADDLAQKLQEMFNRDEEGLGGALVTGARLQ